MPLAMEDEDLNVSARLYVTPPLGAGLAVPLDADQAHYLRAVLRLGPGDGLSLFNGRDGEWRGRIVELGKNRGLVALEVQTRAQTAERDLWLAFAPVKRARIDYIAEKATELGVTRLLPVMTRRTNMARVNVERLQANAREAAEQTERLTVPAVEALQPLDRFLDGFPVGRRLMVCDETGRAPSIARALADGAPRAAPWALLIGPEGGFAPEELDALRKLPFVTAVGLGPRVLRADTAALAALAVFQALAGDWDTVRGALQTTDAVPI
ncbi:ribosomal RNA small subunit methyltransferase E [Aliidongia dinghuensis]|uniref:Ribosomal RNA small subunit methyltransferase E n=1 Tax=Aliidongia dinghuensis TaxID=1867774 RepID=A0A8J2YTL0_9PROT|nr:16S rRNA (uracil(1498)-N(3))-methyltransferase [Aliidongia dinghuensis]GGF16261.1 ribosomal RNA small subunit methyltransferase E [Aliidongia dinghuensis]